MPSGIAGIRVDLNVAEFNAALDLYLQFLNLSTPTTVSQVALDLLQRIQKKTPVDTGRLRQSFHAVLPGEVDSSFPYTDRYGKAFEGALYVAPKKDAKRGEFEAVVGTNVYYALIIEAGHSRQAPSGMVAVSVAEMTGQLEAAVMAAIIAAWGRL